ncbi:hypothetical protein N665_0533s0010 [Sinapis alba]|nr:hypothetical protein N665_0533s0010 [Sinapis alba]
MKVQFDVFRTLVFNWIGRKINRAEIITEDECCFLHSFGKSVRDATVLCFCAGPRNRGLSIGRPGDQIVPQVNAVTGCGSSVIEAFSPVSIQVSCERVEA